IAQAAAEHRSRRSPRPFSDDLLGVQLARRPAADEHRLEPEVEPERIGNFGPPLGRPILLWLARRYDDRRRRPLERRDELALCSTLLRPGAKVPLDRLARHADLGEEFEILILNMLRGARRNAMRREQPVHVARPRTIEPEL